MFAFQPLWDVPPNPQDWRAQGASSSPSGYLQYWLTLLQLERS